MPFAWLSIETTRSRRSLNTLLCFGMKSCGPLSASTAALADAPTGHAIGLRHAVHRERAVVELRLDLRGRSEGEIVVHQVLVHVVGEHPDVGMFGQHVGH